MFTLHIRTVHGSVEQTRNANGLLRQYVPKGSDLRQVSEDVISLAMARINYRPKKCLGFKQPAVIFKEMCMAA